MGFVVLHFITIILDHGAYFELSSFSNLFLFLDLARLISTILQVAFLPCRVLLPADCTAEFLEIVAFQRTTPRFI